MDLLTHTLCGVSIGIAVNKIGLDGNQVALIATATISSLLPDFDGIIKLFSNKNFLKYHRRFTHQIPNALVFALVLPFILLLIGDKNFFIYYFVSLFSLIIHILLDALNPYGTKIFPFYRNIKLNIISSADVIFLLILMLNVYYSLSGNFIMLVILFIYVSIRALFYYQIKKKLKDSSKNILKVHLIAMYNPFKWHVIMEYIDHFKVASYYHRLINIDVIEKQVIDKYYLLSIKETKEFKIFDSLSDCYDIIEIDRLEYKEIKLIDLKYRKKTFYYFQLICYFKDMKITNIYLGFVFSDEKFQKKTMKKIYLKNKGEKEID